MHAAQEQVALWPDAEVLLAAHPQGPFRNANCFAYLRDVERLLRVVLYHPAKPAHHDGVLPSRPTVFSVFLVAKAPERGLYQGLFQPARRIGIGDDFWRFFRQTSGRG